MSDKKFNLEVLSKVIADSERLPIRSSSILDTERKHELFRYILHQRTGFNCHLRDLAKEKSLPINPILKKFAALRLEVLKLFVELYATNNYDDEEATLLEIVKSKLMGSYYNELDQNIEQNKHTSAKQITYTAILLIFAEIYLMFGEEHHFMNYILGSGNALGVVVANHNYVSYEELEKHKSTPIQKGKENLKSKVIPLANKIWIEEDISNLLMPSHVAHLVKRILGTNRADETIMRWFKEENIIPEAIQEMINSKSYPKGGHAREHRKKLESAIYEKLKPVSEKTDN